MGQHMADNTPKSSNMMTRIALQAGTEFISGIIVGLIFGLAIDHFFSTKPFGLIIMVLLGAAAGFRNIFKLVRRDFSEVDSKHGTEEIDDLEKKP